MHPTYLRFQELGAFGHQVQGTFARDSRLVEPADPTLGVGQIGQVTSLGHAELNGIEGGNRLLDHGNSLFHTSALAERPSDDSRRMGTKPVQSMLFRQCEETSPCRQHMVGSA